jgi:hypothetical protein
MTGTVEVTIAIVFSPWGETKRHGEYNVRRKAESINMVLSEARQRLEKIIPENAGCTWFIGDKESYPKQ